MTTDLDTISSIFSAKLQKNDHLIERLPIRMLGGLKVDVFLKTYKNSQQQRKIYLLVEDQIPEIFCLEDDCIGYHEYFRKDFDLKTIDPDEIKKVLEQVILILNNLTFNRLRGVLIEKNQSTIPDLALLWKKLIVAENLEWSIQECVVCMEDTFSTTICDHPLCRLCFQKLKQQKCPSCRQSLTLDDEDDD